MAVVQVTPEKPAPVKVVRSIADAAVELPGRLRVLAVEVDGDTYRVTLARSDGGLAVQAIPAWVVSRSLRGYPDGQAAVRADLLRALGPEAAG